MSSSAAINTFRNGDTSIENFTSMQQTIIQVLRDKDNFDLYNFEYGNTAAPGIVSGSIVGVNYVLYPFNSTELALYLATDGMQADASSAPDGEYVIIFKPSVIGGVGYCTMYVYPFAEGQIVYNSAYGHYVVSGTQNRVVGGVTKSGASWTKKWIYQLNGSSEESTTVARPDPTVRIYNDGADIYFRRIRAYVPGIVGTPISNYTPTASEASAGYINQTIELKYKCILQIWVKYAATPQWKRASIGEADSDGHDVSLFGDNTVLGIGLERLHTDGSWIPYGEPVKITRFNSTYNNKSVCISVDPGTYRIAPVAGYIHTPVGYQQSESWNSPGIGKISVSVLAVQGSTVDY